MLFEKCPRCGYPEPKKPYLKCATGCPNSELEISDEVAKFLAGHNIKFRLYLPNGRVRVYGEIYK